MVVVKEQFDVILKGVCGNLQMLNYIVHGTRTSDAVYDVGH